MDTLLTGFDLADLTGAAAPIVAIGLPIALAIGLGPRLAVKAIGFIKKLAR
jgi:hypothetical protein